MRRLFIQSGILFLCLCCLIAGEKTFAATLTIRMQMTLTIITNQIKVRIVASNHGTEPAHDLQAFLNIFDRSLKSEVIDLLNVQQTQSFDFQVPIPPQKRGRFPVLGEVLYHDTRRHPFSALSCNTFHLKSNTTSDLTARAPDLTIKENGALSVRISNLSDSSHQCKAALYLPHGLSTPVRQKLFVLAPNGQSKVEFLLTNRYGIDGAVYPIFCILEYQNEGVNETIIVKSMVRIKQFLNWFKETKWFWLGGIVPIVLFWAGRLLFRRGFRQSYKE